jgi:hypothetical protein
MLIIIDKKIPETAKRRLANYGKLVEVSTSGISYEAISGHPDIFFCLIKDSLIAAPNLPQNIVEDIEDGMIIYGDNIVENSYPETAHYNAVVTDTCLIHNLNFTDQKILDLCKEKEHIHVEQGYTRCNLLALKEDHFITSDKGIERTLINHGKNVLYINPENIKLEGFSHGFFGGACGVLDDQVFITGNLDFIKNGEEIINWITVLGYQIIELYKGTVFDGGGIIFIND